MRPIIKRQDDNKALPSYILPGSSSIATARPTAGLATARPPTSVSTVTKTPSSTAVQTAQPTTSSAPSSGLPLSKLIPAIVVPIAIVALIAPVLLYFFLTRHDRRTKSLMGSRVSSRAFQDHATSETRHESKSPGFREYSSETQNSKASEIMNFNLGPGVEKPLPVVRVTRSPENGFERNDHLYHPEWPGRPPTADRASSAPRPGRLDRPSERHDRLKRPDKTPERHDRPERPVRPADSNAYEVIRGTGLSPSHAPSPSNGQSPTGGQGPSIGQAISRYSGIHYDNPPPEKPPPNKLKVTSQPYVNRTSIQDLSEENMRIARLATDSKASFGLGARDLDEVSEVSASGNRTPKHAGTRAVDELSDVSSIYTESRTVGDSILGNSEARRSGPFR